MQFNSWLKYYKIQLLCRAWGEGLVPFLRAAWFIFRDVLLYRVRLVYEASLSEITKFSAPIHAQLKVRYFGAWDQVDEPMRKALAANPHEYGWDIPKVLAQGWRMWTGMVSEDLVFVCWTRDASCTDNFHVSLKAGETLLCSAATANGFRGRGIFKAMLVRIASLLKEEGGSKMYIECLDSNTASRRGIERTGFRRFGRVAYWRFSNQWHWIPDGTVRAMARDTDHRPRTA